MLGMSRRVVQISKRATRWRRGGRLAFGLAIVAPVIVVAAVTVPAATRGCHGPGPAVWLVDRLQRRLHRLGGIRDRLAVEYDTGAGSSFGTGEIETMTNSTSNVHLDGNGDLDITALGSGSSWTSGRVQTTSANVGAPAGGELEVTASIEQPTGGLGYWPAFWMLGPGQWPENGEIDIMEDVNSLSEVSGTIHCGTDPGGPCNEPNGIGSGLVACSGCQSGYHTYTMILNRTNTSDESITFYLDGNAVLQRERVAGRHAAPGRRPSTTTCRSSWTWRWAAASRTASAAAPRPTSSTASGGTMSVAYVAAYSTSARRDHPRRGRPITGYHGLCLDDRGASTADFNPIQVYTCNGTSAQQWTVVRRAAP